MREKPNIPEEHLLACLQEHYGLLPVTLDFLPLGLDARAGVYRVVDEHGLPYLLKARLGSLYKPGCLVPRYLNDQGITSVVAPLATKSYALWTQVEDWTMIVYPFIDGDTSWTGTTDEQWKEVGSIFARIHQVALPTRGFESLRKESFDPTEYARWVRVFETQHMYAHCGEGVSEHALRAFWIAYQSTIHTVVIVLEKLAGVLQRQSAASYVICHADLHPANLLRDQAGRVFVIDWDEVMLAPKERDFLFIKATPADSEVLPGTPAFFQGYGQTDIDWIALTYYRYERVIQDLIVSTQEVFFRDDVGETTKADAAQLFRGILAAGGQIDAASASLAHLPSALFS